MTALVLWLAFHLAPAHQPAHQPPQARVVRLPTIIVVTPQPTPGRRQERRVLVDCHGSVDPLCGIPTKRSR